MKEELEEDRFRIEIEELVIDLVIKDDFFNKSEWLIFLERLDEYIENKEKEAFKAGFTEYPEIDKLYDPSSKEFWTEGFKESLKNYLNRNI